MIIIKDSEDALRIIAGEILNFETSTKYFENGTVRPIPEKGYPQITDGGIVYTIKSTLGYIYLPFGSSVRDFIRRIGIAVNQLERSLDGEVAEAVKLTNYQSVDVGWHVNAKVKSSLVNEPNGKNYAKRSFLYRAGSRNKYRFTWIVTTINDYDTCLNAGMVEQGISKHAISIFYDKYDICNLGNGESTFNFSPSMLKGYDNMVVHPDISLFRGNNPLLFELSQHWNEPARNSKSIGLRNIDKKKIFTTTNPVQWAKVSVNGILRNDLCSECKSPLWGDHYALSGPVKNPAMTCSIPICAICLHASPRQKPLEMRYFRILRVTAERSMEDMVEAFSINNQKRRDIYYEIMKGVHYDNTINVLGGTYKYTLIGDKYVAFDNYACYLFSNLYLLDIFSGRKVIKANIIDY